MARALRFQLHDRLAATVASPRIRSGRGRPLCSGWVIRLETKAGWVGLVPRALTRCPRERRRSESNRRIEVLHDHLAPHVGSIYALSASQINGLAAPPLLSVPG